MRKFVLLLTLLLCQLGWAQSIRSISDVDIRVEVDGDGSAWITQQWTAEAGSSGTEFYVPIGNLGPMSISRLQVSENGKAFESVGDKWDVDRSRSWKAGKCGIVRKSNGVELCWGLGEPGPHVWTARFYVTGLVQGYDDGDAFNFMFVNRGMNPAPRHARVTIVPAFECPKWTYDNTRVWAFGFDGDINVDKGQVVAETSSPMNEDCALIALVKFEKGLFQPDVVKGGSVQNLVDSALEGSSYGEDDEDTGFIILAFLALFGGLFYLIWAAVAKMRGFKWKKKYFGKKKITEWYRDIPLEGNLPAAQFLLSKGRRFSVGAPPQNIIGAYFLRWILNGNVTVQPDPKSTKRVNLLFKDAELPGADPVEADLYDWARMAAGENQILEKGEFEKWSKKHYEKMTGWPERAESAGKSWFRKKGYFAKEGTCSEEGMKQACHVIEFNNFLKDFTINDQREAGEVKLWKEYLVYAQLFGIADKVAAQFKKLYPAEFEDLARNSGMDPATLMYATSWANTMSSRAYSGAKAKAGAANGTGGHASFGGGGGFSGGGFGGGGR